MEYLLGGILVMFVIMIPFALVTYVGSRCVPYVIGSLHRCARSINFGKKTSSGIAESIGPSVDQFFSTLGSIIQIIAPLLGWFIIGAIVCWSLDSLNVKQIVTFIAVMVVLGAIRTE